MAIRLTESRLRQIIREEVERSMLTESGFSSSFLKEKHKDIYDAVFVKKEKSVKGLGDVSELADKEPAITVYDKKEKKTRKSQVEPRVFFELSSATDDKTKENLKKLKDEEQAFWEERLKQYPDVELQQVES